MGQQHCRLWGIYADLRQRQSTALAPGSLLTAQTIYHHIYQPRLRELRKPPQKTRQTFHIKGLLVHQKTGRRGQKNTQRDHPRLGEGDEKAIQVINKKTAMHT